MFQTLTSLMMIDAAAQRTAYRIRAIRLPDGERAEDWWLVNGRLQQTPVGDATDLPGAFMLSGLVDAHTHLSLGFGRFAVPHSGAAVVQANLEDKARQGVLAVRDTGVLPGTPLSCISHKQVQIINCGVMHAPAGRFHAGIHAPVEPAALRDALVRAVAGGQTWVKIIADFPGPDFNFFDPIVNYPVAVIADAVTAVHAHGGRVAAHVSGPMADDLVRAGVDSIEHGTQLTAAGVAEMAKRGTAWVPTLSTVVGATEAMAAHGAPFVPVWRAGLEKLRELLPLAERLGVTVLGGSDEQPADFVADLELLHAYGLTARGTLQAASNGARRFLGLPGLTAGAPADLLLFDEDPRHDLSALRRPVAIVCSGLHGASR